MSDSDPPPPPAPPAPLLSNDAGPSSSTVPPPVAPEMASASAGVPEVPVSAPTPASAPAHSPAANPSPSSAAVRAVSVPATALTAAARNSFAQAAPVVHHMAAPPAPLPAPSQLPALLRKLGYVVSIILGSSAVLAGIWSAFILPLLHASFSARNAISMSQKERWRGILDSLRGLRQLAIYRTPLEPAEGDEAGAAAAGSSAEGKELALTRTRSAMSRQSGKSAAPSDGPKEAHISATGSEAPPGDEDDAAEDEGPKDTRPSVPLHPETAALSAALRDLAAGLDSTATTRTSLLSTLEGYTSGLHREVYVSRGVSSGWSRGTGGSVGLSTLSNNLAQAGGTVHNSAGPNASDAGILPPAKTQEWDNVRREVRAIKGMLLNRRNFVVPARSG